ncbi:MAG: hypothetical protein Q9187_008261, partial [Circinaria calcarea]
ETIVQERDQVAPDDFAISDAFVDTGPTLENKTVTDLSNNADETAIKIVVL